MEIGQSADKSYAYLLGVYLGDGCVTREKWRRGEFHPVFRLNTIDRDFAEATRAALMNLTDRKVGINTYAVKKSSKPNHALRCGDPEICKNLVLDCGGATSPKTRLPTFTLESSEKEFAVGLMDSEGFVAAHSQCDSYYMGFKCCDPWLREFVILLQRIGVQIGKVSVCPPLRPHYKTPTRFHIKIDSWVRAGLKFNIKRKQDRVDAWATKHGLSYS